MTLDWSRPLRTKHGNRPVKILSREVRDDYPVLGLIDLGSTDVVWQWTQNGLSQDEADNGFDLVNVPETYVRWINIDAALGGGPYEEAELFKTKEEADKNARYDRLACVRIEFKEGEGL